MPHKPQITNPDPDKFASPEGSIQMFTSPCSNCKWVSPVDGTKCFAFQKGIPQEILSGKNDHSEPYEGDGGIQYEPRSL